MGAGAGLISNTQNPEQQEKETMFPSMMNITENYNKPVKCGKNISKMEEPWYMQQVII